MNQLFPDRQTKDVKLHPLKGILKQHDYGDFVSFLIVCDCADPECSHTLTVEIDNDITTVSIVSKVTTPFWSKSRWYSIFELLFKGYATYYSDILLDKETARNYSNALTMSIDRAKQYVDQKTCNRR